MSDVLGRFNFDLNNGTTKSKRLRETIEFVIIESLGGKQTGTANQVNPIGTSNFPNNFNKWKQEIKQLIC